VRGGGDRWIEVRCAGKQAGTELRRSKEARMYIGISAGALLLIILLIILL
jgi:hypothetical protein